MIRNIFRSTLYFGLAWLFLNLSSCTSTDTKTDDDEVEQSDDDDKNDKEAELPAPQSPIEPALEHADIFTNKAGGDEAIAPAAPVAAQAAPAPEAAKVSTDLTIAQASDSMKSEHSFTYVVRKGDWLSKIARLVYNDVQMWKKIHAANPDIKNPNRIFAGQKIMVPVVNQASEHFAEKYKPSKAPIKKFKKAKKHKTAAFETGKAFAKIALNCGTAQKIFLASQNSHAGKNAFFAKRASSFLCPNKAKTKHATNPHWG